MHRPAVQEIADLTTLDPECIDHFARVYDRYRPRPPAAIMRLLTGIAGVARPRLVIDLGSGTGISTFAWAGLADRIVGVEPSADLREFAEQIMHVAGSGSHIEFVGTPATRLAIRDRAADVVTCAQSLHWMAPGPTLTEIGRVLRIGGVLGVYDYVLPPVFHWEVERAFSDFVLAVNAFEKSLGEAVFGTYQCSPADFLGMMDQSGSFRYAREVFIHDESQVSYESIVGLALSYADVPALIGEGATICGLQLDRLVKRAREVLGTSRLNSVLSYDLRIGVR